MINSNLNDIDFTKMLLEVAKINYDNLSDILCSSNLEIINFANDDDRRVIATSDVGVFNIKIKGDDSFKNINLNINIDTSSKVFGLFNKKCFETIGLDYSMEDDFVDVVGYVITKKKFGNILSFDYSVKKDICVLGKLKSMNLSS